MGDKKRVSGEEYKEQQHEDIPARSTSLDLASAETDNDIGNDVILGLTGAVRDHDTPSGLLGEDGGLEAMTKEKERELVC